jgi:hypothetical protein
LAQLQDPQLLTELSPQVDELVGLLPNPDRRRQLTAALLRHRQRQPWTLKPF